MKISVLKESHPGEARVAMTPGTVTKYKSEGHEVRLVSGAGLAAGFRDSAYEDEGAVIADTPQAACAEADMVLCVNRPEPDVIAQLPEGAALIGLLDPFNTGEALEEFNARKLTTLALEWAPRITRAQPVDALSSQSNLAGYRAALEGAHLYGRAMPMMMTAAGTVSPAKVFVMGAGVAGLQAIATARRLGAVVTATDVRAAAKEQVESLGAKFIAVEDEEFSAAETAGGYAREMSDDYKARQAELTASHISKQDIVITTALIPGRPAPVLITQEMVETMHPGAVIIDMAVTQGGNCPLSRPDEIVEHAGVKVAGFSNLAARVATDASSLYARNIHNFLPLATGEDGSFQLDTEDEIVSAMLLTHGGETVNERLKS
ncbi:MAG: Re/Si-specific NAD(P)(+) transhydrogenase subunit alpha [Alphaproteobacteria bacterium]|jgi:NAD(P) transhydrogenase subunit alpha|nr:Re/Si-specific NAD(P)(+) transhydrogenase subunit alpha [Alphaproteobacteria bacterium]